MPTSLELGKIVITANAAEKLKGREHEIGLALRRHRRGDWGDVDGEDWATNNHALENGSRIVSSYKAGEIVFWIITEADRSVTTVLLPEDY